MSTTFNGSARRKVIAGATRRQFLNWCMENGVPPGRTVFADRREKVMGLELKPEDVVRLGTVPAEIELEIQLRMR